MFIKENSPTSFVVEQKLQTMPGARTMVTRHKDESHTDHGVRVRAAAG